MGAVAGLISAVVIIGTIALWVSINKNDRAKAQQEAEQLRQAKARHQLGYGTFGEYIEKNPDKGDTP